MSEKGIVPEVDIRSFSMGSAALFRVLDSTESPKWVVGKEPETVKLGAEGKQVEVKYMPWGSNNKLPLEMSEAIYADPVLSRGMEYNIASSYGDGPKPMMRTKSGSKLVYVECQEQNVLDFWERHAQFAQYFLEQCTDMSIFYNCVAQILLNDKREVTRLKHTEIGYCRFSKFENGYSRQAVYNDTFCSDEVDDSVAQVLDLLDPSDPIYNLRERLGLDPNASGKVEDEGIRRYGLKINFPTPLRQYYSQPYYTSIFKSGWADFSRLIPQFKKAILKNQATIKYIVTFHPSYFTELFKLEGISDSKKQLERRKAEYSAIDKYLSNVGNSGKAVYNIGTVVKETLMPLIKLEPVDNHFKGGEYLEDSEEVANILSYACGVHPSVIGAAPGKSKSINGTEARELTLIKNALLKPTRDLLLTPFYLVKNINGWHRDLVFTVPFTVLTTLDTGSGAKKNSGLANEKE